MEASVIILQRRKNTENCTHVDKHTSKKTTETLEFISEIMKNSLFSGSSLFGGEMNFPKLLFHISIKMADFHSNLKYNK